MTRLKVGHTEEAMERRLQAFPQNHTLPSPPVLSLGITARHVVLPVGRALRHSLLTVGALAFRADCVISLMAVHTLLANC